MLFNLDRYRWKFDNELKRLIIINCNDNREDLACLVLRTSIELLAKLHDVHTFRTQCRADWRRRVSCATLNLEFNQSTYFFCHCTVLKLIFVSVMLEARNSESMMQ